MKFYNLSKITIMSKRKSAPATQPTKRSKFTDIKQGEYMCEVQYYKVTDKDDQKIEVRNERGFEFGINDKIVEEGLFSASQFSTTKKVSRTELVNHLENAKDTVFTVNFNKQPNEESVKAILEKTSLADFGDGAKRKKLAKELMKGEERTLVGYLKDGEPKLGRSQVVDLEELFENFERKKKGESEKHTERLVDHRTINWLILKNTKYVSK